MTKYCERHYYAFELNGESECKYCKEEREQENAYEVQAGK